MNKVNFGIFKYKLIIVIILSVLFIESCFYALGFEFNFNYRFFTGFNYAVLFLWFFWETRKIHSLSKYFIFLSDFLIVGFIYIYFFNLPQPLFEIISISMSATALFFLILGLHFTNIGYELKKKVNLNFIFTFLIFPVACYVFVFIPFIENLSILNITTVYFVFLLIYLIIIELKTINDRATKNLFYLSAFFILNNAFSYCYYFYINNTSFLFYTYIFSSVSYRFIVNYNFISILNKKDGLN